ncbi:MAG: ABC transporter ATP-binding protein [Kangiellaceae bacterium]|nr:ABC transporter ATP-binding protein [Kangiellaceae bacterium]MCW8999424.1 ABC transporter ATP-binding protein [Kangiellaceae bacterium]MCW9018139.1 ABC transporter ATP-binding protein [Kangiellaceae bacterium]
MSTVTLKKVCKTFGEGELAVHALKDVDLEIKAGGFLCLSGPSGSGKSTLLNMVGGLDRPTSGEITVADKRIDLMSKSELAEIRLHNIGFIFQAYNLIPVLTARENVEFVMQLQGIPTEERHQKSTNILREVGLEGLEDRKPLELSGGQQQRVAVARALVSEPALILADEPTANLDSTNAENLMNLLRHLNDDHKITFLISTHDKLVMSHARRLLKLHDGQIIDDIQQR